MFRCCQCFTMGWKFILCFSIPLIKPIGVTVLLKYPNRYTNIYIYILYTVICVYIWLYRNNVCVYLYVYKYVRLYIYILLYIYVCVCVISSLVFPHSWFFKSWQSTCAPRWCQAAHWSCMDGWLWLHDGHLRGELPGLSMEETDNQAAKPFESNIFLFNSNIDRNFYVTWLPWVINCHAEAVALPDIIWYRWIPLPPIKKCTTTRQHHWQNHRVSTGLSPLLFP